MLVRRRLPLSFVLRFAVPVGVVSGTWAALVFAAYAFGGWGFLRVPFLPLSVMGTAVAFYVGFKNNASYERFWEGRKIWGGIVNASRTWASATCAYVDPGSSSDESIAQRRELIYRQLAWINALRMQLRRTTRFHDKPSGPTKRRLIKHADAMRNDWKKELAPFLSTQELDLTTEQVNAATQLLARQGNQLAELVQSGRLDMFRQLALMEVVQELYALQGQSERIKNTPFSRHYAEYSRIFVYVFAFLVPLGMLDVFAEKSKKPTSEKMWPLKKELPFQR